MWALHVTDGLSDRDKVNLLSDGSEYVRSWAIQLLVEGKNPSSDALRRFARLARQDQSALVRLYLASALQRVPPEKRWDVLSGLIAREEDAGDQNQPLMVWYAAEPMAALDMTRAMALALDARLPQFFSFTVRRIAAVGTPDALRLLADRLAHTDNVAQQKDLVDGINLIVKKP
jgi:hypothetical protein